MRVALIAATLLTTAAQAKEPATLATLEQLAAQHAWDELLERAEDIAPSNRDERWSTQVTAAATAVLTSGAGGVPFERVARADRLADRYRFLQSASGFITARDAAVATGAERCMSETGDAPCWKALKELEPTLSPAGAFSLASVLKKNGALPWRVMALFARGVTAKDAPTCRDAALQSATLGALELPEGDAAARDARAVAFDLCWAALQPKLRAAMVGASRSRLRNSCKALRARGALTDMQEALCRDEEQ